MPKELKKELSEINLSVFAVLHPTKQLLLRLDIGSVP
jgi:hypothetical protein